MTNTTVTMIDELGLPRYITFDTFKNGTLISIQRVYPEGSTAVTQLLVAKARYDLQSGIPLSTVLSELRSLS